MEFKKRIIKELKKPLTQKQILLIEKYMASVGKNNKNKTRCCLKITDKDVVFYWVVGQLDNSLADEYTKSVLGIIEGK